MENALYKHIWWLQAVCFFNVLAFTFVLAFILATSTNVLLLHNPEEFPLKM